MTNFYIHKLVKYCSYVEGESARRLLFHLNFGKKCFLWNILCLNVTLLINKQVSTLEELINVILNYLEDGKYV